MHPSVQLTLHGIAACRRHLDKHPGQPVTAVNPRFDFAEASASVHEARARRPLTRWIELCPHSAGITIHLVDGARRALAGSVLYPATPEPTGAVADACAGDGLWLGIDPGAITAPAFLTKLAAVAARALEHLDSFPEALHG